MTTGEANFAAQMKAGFAQIEAGLHAVHLMQTVSLNAPSLVPTLSEVDAAAPSLFQTLSPALLIDWPPAAPGSISYDMVNFCDQMPADPTTDVFVPRSTLSSAYALCLELVQPTFQPAAVLTQAKNLVAVPAGNPALAPSPPGWAKTTDAGGIIRWAPVYALSPPIPTLTVPSSVMQPFTATASTTSGLPAGDILARADESTSVAITAQDWSRIAVTPGQWFNSALLQMLRGAPFYSPYVALTGGLQNPATPVFGTDGLLSARISALLVASTPTVVVSTPTPQAQLVADLARSGTSTLAGLPLGGDVTVTQDTSPVVGTSTVSARLNGALAIVGVALSPM